MNWISTCNIEVKDFSMSLKISSGLTTSFFLKTHLVWIYMKPLNWNPTISWIPSSNTACNLGEETWVFRTSACPSSEPDMSQESRERPSSAAAAYLAKSMKFH